MATRDVAKAVRGAGRVAVFDGFVRDDERVPARRRMLNIVAKPLLSGRRAQPFDSWRLH
jgi:hypothetical protein